MQFKFKHYELNLTWFGVLLTLACVILFIKLGLWQYQKAIQKQAIEDAYQASKTEYAVDLSQHLNNLQLLTFKNVRVIGKYEPEYQILIDNQVDSNQAGYHVLTPFKISGTNDYVLVNRGWIKGYDQHATVPNVNTPLYEHEIHGMLWEPSNKIFSLEKEFETGDLKFKPVWQHLDIKKYQKVVPLKVLSSIVKLDPNQADGGFVRNWQLPPSRIATNLGYAYQWFGFAIAAIGIFGYLSITRVKKENE